MFASELTVQKLIWGKTVWFATTGNDADHVSVESVPFFLQWIGSHDYRQNRDVKLIEGELWAWDERTSAWLPRNLYRRVRDSITQITSFCWNCPVFGTIIHFWGPVKFVGSGASEEDIAPYCTLDAEQKTLMAKPGFLLRYHVGGSIHEIHIFKK